METIKGVLDFGDVSEIGPYWIVKDESVVTLKAPINSYPLHFLATGDILRVFNEESRNTILWEGEVCLKRDVAQEFYGEKYLTNYTPRTLQAGIKPDSWLEMFSKQMFCEVIPAAQVPSP